MTIKKIISFNTLFLLLIGAACIPSSMYAVVALNHGRGGPHKFGWQNTSDRDAYRRAFVSERALEKSQQKKLVGRRTYKQIKLEQQERGNRYEHSY